MHLHMIDNEYRKIYYLVVFTSYSLYNKSKRVLRISDVLFVFSSASAWFNSPKTRSVITHVSHDQRISTLISKLVSKQSHAEAHTEQIEVTSGEDHRRRTGRLQKPNHDDKFNQGDLSQIIFLKCSNTLNHSYML